MLVSAGKAYTLAQRKREGQPLDTEEMTALTTCVQVYLDSGEPVEALQATLIKTVCWDDWSEMHMWKAVGAAPNPFPPQLLTTSELLVSSELLLSRAECLDLIWRVVG